jgi:hypothetical protein
MSAAAAPVVSTAFSSAGKRSIGDINIEIQDVALVSGNTTMVATASALSRVDYAIFIGGGIGLTAVTTYSTNTATFAFTDPAATIKGTVILFGR